MHFSCGKVVLKVDFDDITGKLGTA